MTRTSKHKSFSDGTKSGRRPLLLILELEIFEEFDLDDSIFAVGELPNATLHLFLCRVTLHETQESQELIDKRDAKDLKDSGDVWGVGAKRTRMRCFENKTVRRRLGAISVSKMRIQISEYKLENAEGLIVMVSFYVVIMHQNLCCLRTISYANLYHFLSQICIKNHWIFSNV